MRILLISPVPPEVGGADTGGIASHGWGLATHLAAAGHDVAVLADNVPCTGVLSKRIQGVTVYAGKSFAGLPRLQAALSPATAWSILSTRKHLGPTWRLGWVASAVAVLELCMRDFRPDVVHVHGIEARLAVALHTLRGRAPLLATTHSTHYFEYAPTDVAPIHRGLVERNLAKLDRIVFVSHYLEGRYRELFPKAITRMQTRVILNPLDAGRYAPGDRLDVRRSLGAGDSERVALFVGNLIGRKRPELFVETMARLHEMRDDVRGLIVGDGPLRHRVGELIAKNGLSDIVTLEGSKSSTELVGYYTAADVFVLPSAMESFGLVAVEAMLCGCPVVGTFEAMREVVPASAGTFVADSDPGAIAEAVASAMDREWDRDALRALALGHDWNDRIGEFVSAYESAVEDA